MTLSAVGGVAHAGNPTEGVLYEVTDLGTLGGELANAFKINDLGQAVGQAEEGEFGAANAFLWEQGVMNNLGSLNDFNTGSSARDVNELGHVVGSALAPAPGFPGALAGRPFYWTPEGGMIDITPSPDEPGIGGAFGLNDNGAVVGDWRGRGFLWTSSTGMTFLPTFPDAIFPEAFPRDLNNAGDVVGRSWAGEDPVPVIWPAEGGIVQLPGINGGVDGQARAVNEAGVVVGEVDNEFGLLQPVIWNDGALTQIRLLPDPLLDGGSAEAINDHGVIVGWDGAFAAGGVPPQGWVRTPDGTKARLNDVIIDPTGEWDIRFALGINNSGQIVGIANRTLPDGTDVPGAAFLLTPVDQTSPDLDGDGLVGASDLGALLAAWGPCEDGSCPADLDGDGFVGTSDLGTLIAAWSATPPRRE